MNNVSTIPPAASRMTGLVPDNFEQAIQLANIMATSKLVPAALQKSPGDCLMVIEQAIRWRMSSFAVAQEVSVIQGRLMFSGKIVAAALHSAPGLLVGRLDYRFTGTGNDLQVEVVGHLRGEDAPRTITVRLADARTTNVHWNKSPEQMLSYHGARVWGRRHAPEILLGVSSPEEWPAPAPASDHDAAPPRHITRTTDAMALPAPPMPLHAPPAPSEHELTATPAPAPARPAPAPEREAMTAIPDMTAPAPDRALQWLEAQLAKLATVTFLDELHWMARDAKVYARLAELETKRPELAAQYNEAMRLAMETLTEVEGGE